ncbi:histidine phosphatase family protein [Sporosarcina sp. Marseille-Q4063]|uniref:histidine phosphatase family protein n=1 Tax=Sporosarcina sp. Marseille-Q4063 TaxID=2810514 RepID=UPI001BAEB68E|nr:histidine phosphatase family protein [Sporosarcina sp. Marseille-Q4063]QUW20435.1 histidine phosphatase family protein [Sporosarcina sp. Marseille-Q4063]
MEKVLYLVRHCEAEGQSPHAKLTPEGKVQAEKLLSCFDEIQIDRIISSPFVRARCTVLPLAESKGLYIEQNSDLTERVLSSQNEVDWMGKLEDSFSDVHLKYKGGESSIEAMTRAYKVVKELKDDSHTVIVTHGNLMTLLLRCFDKRFGFEEWSNLTNPDVYRIKFHAEDVSVERIWDDCAA